MTRKRSRPVLRLAAGKAGAVSSACLLALAFPGASPVGGQVRLPRHFSNHMVLQQNMPVPLWGWARPGERVTVEFAGQKRTAEADAEGCWMVRLEPLQASVESRTLRAGDVELRDVLVGEVWVACGQSNMEMPVGDSYRPKPYPGVKNFRQEIAEATFPNIRLCRPGHQTSLTPKKDLPLEGWEVCSPETVGRFSATGYFFARQLFQTQGVPVGIIQLAKSSTRAEAWTGEKGLRTIPRWSRALDQRQKKLVATNVVPPAVTGTEADDLPPPPTVEVGFSEPAALYNGMVAPLVPMAMGGVIYYQGESNAKDPGGYRVLFPTLIRSWREAWGQGDFPFLFVQLAAYGRPQKQPVENGGWAALREAQTAALAEPATGMVVAIDIGDARRIHPPNKQEVGRRLGLMAAALGQGKTAPFLGPRYRSFQVEGARVRIYFDGVEDGLMAGPHHDKCAVPGDGVRVCGFAVEGRDGVFHRGEARLDGDTVVVSSPAVLEPVSVRYAWAGNPDANLAGRSGLPAAPFRTDAPLNR